jgi:hypothetical protein
MPWREIPPAPRAGWIMPNGYGRPLKLLVGMGRGIGAGGLHRQ